MKNIFLKTVAFMLAGIMLLGFTACNDRGLPSVNGGDDESGTRGADMPDNGENLLSRSTDLMEGVSCKTVNSRPADDRFIKSQAEFALALFKESMKDGVNSLVSPLSVTLALAMTANGADGETLAEMEKLLGGDIPIDELNEYLHTYVSRLPSDEKAKLNIANSIWFKDDEDSLVVNKDFLQRNADYYGASAYKSPFDDSTVGDINGWVDENTDGMIKKLLDNIPEEAVMYLINAICFDAEWSNPFNLSNHH